MKKQKPAPTSAIRYNGGIITPNQWGTFTAVIHWQGQRVLRVRKKTLTDARDCIDEAIINLESGRQPLTTLQLEEARQVIAALPQNTTLTDLLRFYVARHAKVDEAITVSAATEKYIESQAKRGLRDRSMRAERGYINRLAKALPNTLMTDLTVDMLATALEDLGVNGVTYNNYRRYWAIFGDWCIKRNYTQENPAKRIEDHLVEDEIAEFFPVPEVRRWFKAVEETDHTLLPYMYLNFFAGIRASELHRMTGDLITPDLIKVTPKISKTRSMRHITPEPSLRAWIEAYPPKPGRLTTEFHLQRVREVRNSLPAFNWVHNGGRKSCATYMLELTQDAPKTASVLGHKSTDLLYSTYRGLTTKEEAQAYFNILPSNH